MVAAVPVQPGGGVGFGEQGYLPSVHKLQGRFEQGQGSEQESKLFRRKYVSKQATLSSTEVKTYCIRSLF